MVFNLFVVWFATGIWHGANWTFILWGVLYGVLITIEKLTSLPQKMERGAWWRWIYQPFTLLSVVCGWVIFRALTLSDALVYLKTMFGFSGNVWVDNEFLFNFGEIKWILLAGILCSAPVLKKLTQRIAVKHLRCAKTMTIVGYAFQIFFFIIGISYLVMNAHNPFIYFNF
jgi:hypothetical protein